MYEFETVVKTRDAVESWHYWTSKDNDKKKLSTFLTRVLKKTALSKIKRKIPFHRKPSNILNECTHVKMIGNRKLDVTMDSSHGRNTFNVGARAQMHELQMG